MNIKRLLFIIFLSNKLNAKSKTLFEIQTEYLSQFWEKYSDLPKLFMFLTNYPHESTGELIQHLDEPLEKFLRDFYNQGNLKNTELLIFSDHGSHFLTSHSPFFPDDSRHEENMLGVLFYTKTDEYREFSNLVWTVFDSLNCSISHSRQHFISLAGSLMLTNSKTHFNELQIALSTFGIVFLIYLELHESDSVFAPIWAGICTWFAKSSFFDWLNSSANLWPLLKSNKAEFVFSYMLRLYKRPKSNSLTPNLTQLSVQSFANNKLNFLK